MLSAAAIIAAAISLQFESTLKILTKDLQFCFQPVFYLDSLFCIFYLIELILHTNLSFFDLGHCICFSCLPAVTQGFPNFWV